jgi:hypothetical protein
MFGKYRKPKQNIVDDYINSGFESGVKQGIKQAIDELRDVQKYKCFNLSLEEKQKVMKFLIENNLEFGYSLEHNGFYVLKKINN